MGFCGLGWAFQSSEVVRWSETVSTSFLALRMTAQQPQGANTLLGALSCAWVGEVAACGGSALGHLPAPWLPSPQRLSLSLETHSPTQAGSMGWGRGGEGCECPPEAWELVMAPLCLVPCCLQKAASKGS